MSADKDFIIRHGLPLCTMNRKILFRWIKVLLIAYGGIGIALYYLQEKFLFHPEELPASYQFKFDMPFEEANIRYATDETINLVKFFPADTGRKGVVVYFHGNRANITRYARFAKNFTGRGYEVWMPDYPGYGKSIGERTEKKMYQQALQVQKMAASKYSADSIIIYGKSLGTGVATYVAAESKNKLLLLETPYYSIPSLFSSYAPIYPTGRMANYKFPVNEYLVDVPYPVVIFHGTDDGVIPYRNAAKLKKVLKSSDEFISLEGGGHHNLNKYELMQHKLDSLLQFR